MTTENSVTRSAKNARNGIGGNAEETCGRLPTRRPRRRAYARAMTIIWFGVWLVSTLIGDDEALTFDPVNVWAGALLLCVALDLGRQHTKLS